MDDSFRGFIAIELPEHLITFILKVQDNLHNLPGYIKWVKPESIHLTLHFLGETPRKMVTPLTDALNETIEGVTPFDLQFEGIGVFPNLHHPRVIWLGVHGELELLRDLHKKIVQVVNQFGFKIERRKYAPHLTIARVKSSESSHSWSRVLQETTVENSPLFSVSSCYLYESILKPTGAQYNKLACFRF